MCALQNCSHLSIEPITNTDSEKASELVYSYIIICTLKKSHTICSAFGSERFSGDMFPRPSPFRAYRVNIAAPSEKTVSICLGIVVERQLFKIVVMYSLCLLVRGPGPLSKLFLTYVKRETVVRRRNWFSGYRHSGQRICVMLSRNKFLPNGY